MNNTNVIFHYSHEYALTRVPFTISNLTSAVTMNPYHHHPLRQDSCLPYRLSSRERPASNFARSIEGCPPARILLTNLQGYAQMDLFGRMTLVHDQCSSHQPLT